MLAGYQSYEVKRLSRLFWVDKVVVDDEYLALPPKPAQFQWESMYARMPSAEGDLWARTPSSLSSIVCKNSAPQTSQSGLSFRDEAVD
jgi:hypothetical protein